MCTHIIVLPATLVPLTGFNLSPRSQHWPEVGLVWTAYPAHMLTCLLGSWTQFEPCCLVPSPHPISVSWSCCGAHLAGTTYLTSLTSKRDLKHPGTTARSPCDSHSLLVSKGKCGEDRKWLAHRLSGYCIGPTSPTGFVKVEDAPSQVEVCPLLPS